MTAADRVKRISPRVAIVVGLLCGATSGLLGVGGGFLIVPLLVGWLGMGSRRAAGTSLFAIIPIAIVGACAYYLAPGSPRAHMAIAIPIALGSMAGAYVGARLIERVHGRMLVGGITALLCVAAVSEIGDAAFSARHGAHMYSGIADHAVTVLAFLTGGAIGVVSGLTGVGGGILVVPTLVLGFGLPQAAAQGASLLAIIPTAAVGAAVHLRRGTVETRTALLVGAAGAAASVAGATLAIMAPHRALQVAFGAFLLLAAARMWPRR